MIKKILLLSPFIPLHFLVKAQVVTTIATGISQPLGLTVGKLDTVYVASISDFRIRKIDPTGTVSVFVGSGSNGSVDGTGTSASISGIYDMEYSQTTGNLYFTEYSSGTVRKVSPAGVVTTLAVGGATSSGIGTALGLNDTLFTYSRSTGAFRSVDPTGAVVSIATIPASGIDLEFASPDTFYLAGYNNQQIYRISRAGAVTSIAGTATGGFADGTGTAAAFNNPGGIAVDGSGTLFVSDYSNVRIRRVTAAGVVTTFAGNSTTASTDGTGTAASFSNPLGMGISRSTGNLYVADNTSGRIRMITGGVPLPLDWLSYNAALNEQNKAVLDWKVKENKVASYHVMKSANGKNFEQIGTLRSLGDGEHQYSFTEPNSLSGTAYYRISQVDVDGKSSSTATLVLKGQDIANSTKIYPTVFADGFTIECSSAQICKLNNSQGQIIQLIDLSAGKNYISMDNQPAGTYYLQTDAVAQVLIKK